MDTSLRFLVSNSTCTKITDDARPAFNGQLIMKVWWADGRVTQTVCANYGQAYDIIGGNAHPYEKWEIHGVVEALKPGSYIRVTAGSRRLGIAKNAVAVITEIQPLGAAYSHSTRVGIQMARGGEKHTLVVRHINRLSDAEFNLASPWGIGKITARRGR